MQSDLVERAREGDHDAFADLARESSDRMFALASLILGDAEAARDTLQEALILAWRDIRALREPVAWEAWSNRLTVRACYRLAKRERKRTSVQRMVGPDDPKSAASAFVAGRSRSFEGVDSILEPVHTQYMSKRLQVVMPDDEYRAVVSAARRRGQPVSRLVRDSLRRTLAEAPEPDPDRRIAAVLRFARFAGPTGDVQQLLEEVDRGRGIPVIYVDSNVPMYLIGAEHPNKARVVIVPRLLSARESLVTSAETFQEIVHRYIAIGDRVHLNAAYEALETMVGAATEVRKEDVDRARSISADHASLSSRDCLHVSIMRRLDCARIWSYDTGFDVVPSILRIG